jgi:adenosylcobyric acid synthase
LAHAISVLGTASDVGKTLVATGLGRLLSDAGLDVAPYKAQNMGNQAGVTAEGLEMPRAQILQAAACRKAPHVDMGPVLLKPLTLTGAQVVMLGKVLGVQEAREYFRDANPCREAALGALHRLAARHEVIVLEGAGSPVELNLMSRDFVNLVPARELDAALVLVADIDRGGVFAQVVGTLDLLPPADRARVLGIVVNRFRGDAALFEDGIGILEARTGLPVLALVPHLEHGLDEEDQPFRIPVNQAAPPGKLKVGAVLYPRVSNTEDLAPLLAEPDLHLTWVTDPALARDMDLLVLPGSKATVGDGRGPARRGRRGGLAPGALRRLPDAGPGPGGRVRRRGGAGGLPGPGAPVREHPVRGREDHPAGPGPFPLARGGARPGRLRDPPWAHLG